MLGVSGVVGRGIPDAPGHGRTGLSGRVSGGSVRPAGGIALRRLALAPGAWRRSGGGRGVDLLAEYRRAEQFLAAGDPVSAARLLEPICAAEPANSEVRLQLALAYFGSAQLTRAEVE